MDTPLLDLTPGLAASARVVGELPAGPDIDAPLADADVPRADGAGTPEAEQDCKPD
jgi:hypothetical protein